MTIPIVMVNDADPVGCRFGYQFGAAGGNVTGLSSLGVRVGYEKDRILKDAVPKLARVGASTATGSEYSQTANSKT